MDLNLRNLLNAAAARPVSVPSLELLPAMRAAVIANDVNVRPGPCIPNDDLTIGRTSTRVRRYTPARAREDGVICYMHGGGWVAGGPTYGDALCRLLAAELGMVTLNIDYRLAPAAPFPAQLEDLESAVEWAVSEYPRSSVLLVGDSAGGNLVAGWLVTSESVCVQAIRAAVLMYPVLDPSMATDSYREFATGFLLRSADMAWFWDQYAGRADRQDPRLAPALAPLDGGFPPVGIAVAGLDPLRDEAIEFHQRLDRAGIASELIVFDELVHGFHRMTALVGQADAAVGEIVALARRTWERAVE